jgi:hypothetical protein
LNIEEFLSSLISGVEITKSILFQFINLTLDELVIEEIKIAEERIDVALIRFIISNN